MELEGEVLGERKDVAVEKRERKGLGGWLGELVSKHFIELER